ncbi:hypothetical protein C8F04DRAFT_1270258 [Mycena alexandri]|uniref:Uncharacterized protein n=1 Tax=Mycena alexandri TaxID=1745969 RepID=A0AAD6WX64_9AGAR|nr:hypothetical protein C8F04DRAFT_1270258 [Mycena alexandri]
MQLSYLSTISRTKGISQWRSQKLKSFRPFDDKSSEGYHGFVPSSQWLRDLFDNFIEEHGHEFDQHTALLEGFINALDHSFKLAKHIAKVNGEQIFIATTGLALTTVSSRRHVTVHRHPPTAQTVPKTVHTGPAAHTQRCAVDHHVVAPYRLYHAVIATHRERYTVSPPLACTLASPLASPFRSRFIESHPTALTPGQTSPNIRYI